MKLVSLYIESFGCLRGFELDFEAGLTTLSRPNGFGKTTLAEFIRAMFYGFPRKTKTLEKSKRQKYTPWGGGAFGGNLVFEHEGQCYRIERTFGVTPKGDTFKLIDLASNRKTNRFSAEIGIELFGLDSDSFERSIYLPQMQESDTLTTAAIQAKLTDLVEDSGDVGNYDRAIALLKARRSTLIPYRGSGGTVAEAAEQITALQLQLDRAQHQYERLKTLQDSAAQTAQERENMKAALAQVQQKLAAASEAAARSVSRDRYERLQDAHSQTQTQIRALQERYRAGFPESSELTQAEAKTDKLAVLENQIASFDAQGHLPSQEEMETCRRNCEEYAALQQKLRAAESTLAEQMQKERETLSLPPEKTGTAVAAWVAAVLGIGGAVVLMAAKQLLFGSIALGIGIAAVITACVLTLRRKKHLRAQVLQKKQESDLRIAAAQQYIAGLRRHCAQYSAEISQLFAACGMDAAPQHFPAGLAQLEHRMQISRQIRQWEAEMAQLRLELDAFFARCGQEPGHDARACLRRMHDDLRQVRTLTARKRELEEHLARMEREHPDIASLPPLPGEDVLPLRQKQQHLQDAYASLTDTLLQQKQELQHLQTQTAQIPQLRDELARLQSKMTEDRENARILDETMAFLQQARERLSTGYMGTIRSRFDYYLANLEASTGEKYLIDTDFQVHLERMGQVRELAYFSAGQTDLVMLCMRLALVDALFKEENMFVILDDPFVNLDDTHTAQAQKLLRSLSRERQILYLTCHSSRTI